MHKRMLSLLRSELVLSVPALKAALPARFKQTLRGAFLRTASLVNAGSRVECAVCDRRFRKFARFHGANDQCPGCGALMRHRAIMLYLRNELHLHETENDVLHVGPAEAVRRRLSTLPPLRYLSLDIDPTLADVPGDVTGLRFRDESFDFALCVHVLEHVADDRAAIGELYRVLRPGGRALIQVPPSSLEATLEDPSVTSPYERERLFGQHDHVRICGADYVERLEEPGFGVDLVDYVARLEPREQARYGLRVGEPFYLCTKPPATE
jgi:SAM-dependent methyltransferase